MMAIRFVLGQHGKVDFVSTSLLKQQSAGRYIAPLGHIFLITSQAVRGHFPLCCVLRSNTYHFFSLWFDPIMTLLHDIPHSQRTR